MPSFLLALLGSLGFVLAIGAGFVLVYQRQLRRLRRANRSFDQLTALTARRPTVPFALPSRWLAIKSSNTPYLRDLLGLEEAPHCSWAEALSRARERELFLSPPVDGWSLLIGGALPDPATDVDTLFHFLTRLSAEIGEVQFFSADRVLSFHSWALVRSGRTVRGYAWAGETQWNEGRITLDERLLGLKSREYGEQPEPLAYGEVAPEQQNTERVILLARRWSCDPIIASEVILQQEGLASEDDFPEHE